MNIFRGHATKSVRKKKISFTKLPKPEMTQATRITTSSYFHHFSSYSGICAIRKNLTYFPNCHSLTWQQQQHKIPPNRNPGTVILVNSTTKNASRKWESETGEEEALTTWQEQGSHYICVHRFYTFNLMNNLERRVLQLGA